MHKKVPGLVISILVICIVVIFVAYSLLVPGQQALVPTGPMDFTVSGASDCLRFLNSSVPTVYVPFTLAANQNWQLTVNATKMPGGVNGWTDVYIYRGYWDSGTNHTCKSVDLYPILNDIESTNDKITISAPYNATFNSSTQQSYTIFFVFPPGGPATFKVSLKQI